MIESSGQEYILETSQQRTTSVVVRPAGHLCTLIQKTPLGISVVDLSEGAKEALLGLLHQPFAPAHLRQDQAVAFEVFQGSLEDLKGLFDAEPQKRKPGRPPKSA